MAQTGVDVISSSVFVPPLLNEGVCSTLSVKLISDWAGGGRMSDICAPWAGVDVFSKRKKEKRERQRGVDRFSVWIRGER